MRGVNVRRRRRYKEELNKIRYQLYKANQILDVIEAIYDIQYKPSYWNAKKLISRLKKLKIM